MYEFYNRHYIMTKSDGTIIDAWSDGPHPEKDTTNAICINERGSYQFRIYHDGEENPPIYDMNSIPLYKWTDGNIIHRTNEEIEEERAALLNSPSSRIAEIKRKLTRLDAQTIRPLRAILAGTSTYKDKDKLEEIEVEAEKLREEMNRLQDLPTVQTLAHKEGDKWVLNDPPH